LLVDRVSAIGDRQRSGSRPAAVRRHTERHGASAVAVRARYDRDPLGVALRRPLATVQGRNGDTRIARARWQCLRFRCQRKAARRCFLHHPDVALVDDDLAFPHRRHRIGRRAKRDRAVSLSGCRREFGDPAGLCRDGPGALRLSRHGDGPRSAVEYHVRWSGYRELALCRRWPGGDLGGR